MLVFLLLLSFPSALIRADPIELSDIIIAEQTPVGHLLVQLNTSRNAQTSYRFVSSNHREIQGYFALNSSTGELRLAKDLNRRAICTHRHVPCRIVLKIFELFNEKLYHIPVRVEDVTDARPRFLYNSSEVEFHLSENSPIYQSKLFIQQVYHPDQKHFKYQLKKLDRNFPFALELNNDLPNRLALVLTQPLDRETVDSYRCTLHLSDASGDDEQLQINIVIDDVNDQSPM